MFVCLQGGGSLSGGEGLCPGDIPVRGGGGVCPGGSLSRGDLCPRGSLLGYVRAVCILLECILVNIYFRPTELIATMCVCEYNRKTLVGDEGI